MEFTKEQLVLLRARKIAFLHGIAVVFSVISILILANAVYKDRQFSNFLSNDGRDWTGRIDNTTTTTTISINLHQLPWIQEEQTLGRGELDCILLIGLILLALTHIALLIFLMFDIPSPTKRNVGRTRRDRRRQQKARPSSPSKPKSNSSERLHSAKNLDPGKRGRDLNGKSKKVQLLVAQDDNENQLAASAITQDMEDAADNNEPSSSGIRGDHHGAPKPNNPSKRKESERMSLPDLDSYPDPDPEPDSTHHHPTSHPILETTKAQRRWRCHTIIMLYATLPLCTFTLILIAGLCLECYLVDQLNAFYMTTDSPKETFPFPGVCSMERIDELRDYNRDKEGKYAWDFASHGACNDFMLKLHSVGISIGSVIISISLVILYGLRYRRLTKAESKLFAGSKNKNKVSDSLHNFNLQTHAGSRGSLETSNKISLENVNFDLSNRKRIIPDSDS